MSRMSRRYPRKFVSCVSTTDGAIKTLVVTRPGAKSERYLANGERSSDGIDESGIDDWLLPNHPEWIEVFDHHKEEMEIEAQFEKRCAIIYLKSVVRDIRKEHEWLRKEHNSLKEKLARQEEQLRAMRAKLEGRKKALRHGKRKATSQTTTP